MSDEDAQKALQAIRQLEGKFEEMQAQRRQRDEAEHGRRAALSPAERAAEDRAKIFQQYLKMGAPILSRESWSLNHFAWLLLAEHPTKHVAWISADQRQTRAVLESCVGVTLRPINPAARAEDQRFPIADLIEVAQAKQLGHVALLRALLENPKLPYRPKLKAAPTPADRNGGNRAAADVKSLPAAGTRTREKTGVVRRKQLIEFALELALSGLGSCTPESIELSINAIALNDQFRKRFPQWRAVSDQTLNRDRRACIPRIHVSMGRPSEEPR